MPSLNNQPVLITSSGLLSAQTGPGQVGFGTNIAIAQESTSRKKIRISGIAMLKIGAAGSVEVFDKSTASYQAQDSVFEYDASGVFTNLGILCKSGDIYIKITGGWKVWLYLDFNA